PVSGLGDHVQVEAVAAQRCAHHVAERDGGARTFAPAAQPRERRPAGRTAQGHHRGPAVGGERAAALGVGQARRERERERERDRERERERERERGAHQKLNPSVTLPGASVPSGAFAAVAATAAPIATPATTAPTAAHTYHRLYQTSGTSRMGAPLTCSAIGDCGDATRATTRSPPPRPSR